MKGKKGVERSATTGRLVGPLQLLLSEAARDKLKYKLVLENKRFQSGDDDPDLGFSHLFLDLPSSSNGQQSSQTRTLLDLSVSRCKSLGWEGCSSTGSATRCNLNAICLFSSPLEYTAWSYTVVCYFALV